MVWLACLGGPDKCLCDGFDSQGHKRFQLGLSKGYIVMKTSNKSLKAYWQASLLVVLSAFAVTLPEVALATAVTAPAGLDNMFCTVAGWFTGSTGKGLATIAITIVGIGALLGKVSWGMAMIVGVGVAVIFGAASIVEALGVDAPTGGSGGCS